MRADKKVDRATAEGRIGSHVYDSSDVMVFMLSHVGLLLELDTWRPHIKLLTTSLK